MIKRFCDVCGKEIKVSEDAHYFDQYMVCEECYKILLAHLDEWHKKIEKQFKEWACAVVAAGELRKKSKPAKAELPYVHVEDIKPKARLGKGDAHTHVCKCKDGKPAAEATVKGTPKGHVHKLVTTPELARSIGAKVHTVQCFALRKGLGIFDRKRRAKVFSEADVKVITSHFRATK